ncbi:MAG: hypothetical protein ABIG45_03145 [Bacillota bacterium]
MTDFFLRYSLSRQRKIRVMLMLDGILCQKNAAVLALDDTQAKLSFGAKKKPVTVNLSDILSCDYARGDHGEDE